MYIIMSVVNTIFKMQSYKKSEKVWLSEEKFVTL